MTCSVLAKSSFFNNNKCIEPGLHRSNRCCDCSIHSLLPDTSTTLMATRVPIGSNVIVRKCFRNSK